MRDDEFSPWLDRGRALRAQFLEAEPFPLVIVDDFLAVDLAAALFREFPDIDAMPKSRDYVFGNKRELSSLDSYGPASKRFYTAGLSTPFRQFLRDLTGWEVFVDPAFHGGGFHQGGDGSFLDFHVDFNVHPLHPNWLRMLNVLLYLNPEWHEAFGGELIVKSSPDGEPRKILPRFNRAVIMETSDRTYHGYRKMSLPPGVTRKSIATYAYRTIRKGEVAPRTTGWVPEGAGMVKRVLARNYSMLVRAKNKLLGSGTARNR